MLVIAAASDFYILMEGHTDPEAQRLPDFFLDAMRTKYSMYALSTLYVGLGSGKSTKFSKSR